LQVARAVGISRETYSRIELGRGGVLDIARAALITAALGSELSVKTFPAGQPIRDVAHAALLQRLQRELATTWRVTHESPMSISGDMRAWDLRLDGAISIGVEAETRPRDLQALERRMQLKQRDSAVKRLLLAVSATDRNRVVLRQALPSLRSTFPLGTREMMPALRSGVDPGANGIVLL